MWEGVWKIFYYFFPHFSMHFYTKTEQFEEDTFCNTHKCIAGFKALKTSTLSLPTNQGHFQLTIHLTIILDINFPTYTSSIKGVTFDFWLQLQHQKKKQ